MMGEKRLFAVVLFTAAGLLGQVGRQQDEDFALNPSVRAMNNDSVIPCPELGKLQRPSFSLSDVSRRLEINSFPLFPKPMNAATPTHLSSLIFAAHTNAHGLACPDNPSLAMVSANTAITALAVLIGAAVSRLVHIISGHLTLIVLIKMVACVNADVSFGTSIPGPIATMEPDLESRTTAGSSLSVPSQMALQSSATAWASTIQTTHASSSGLGPAGSGSTSGPEVSSQAPSTVDLSALTPAASTQPPSTVLPIATPPAVSSIASNMTVNVEVSSVIQPGAPRLLSTASPSLSADIAVLSTPLLPNSTIPISDSTFYVPYPTSSIPDSASYSILDSRSSVPDSTVERYFPVPISHFNPLISELTASSHNFVASMRSDNVMTTPSSADFITTQYTSTSISTLASEMFPSTHVVFAESPSPTPLTPASIPAVTITEVLPSTPVVFNESPHSSTPQSTIPPNIMASPSTSTVINRVFTSTSVTYNEASLHSSALQSLQEGSGGVPRTTTQLPAETTLLQPFASSDVTTETIVSVTLFSTFHSVPSLCLQPKRQFLPWEVLAVKRCPQQAMPF
ncbi:hypothetical protein EMCRGX_G014510 [Ephydatia muelleri]